VSAKPQPQTVRLPHRPRLNDQALLRRHQIDGDQRIVIFDTEREEVLEIGQRELDVLRCCDGTRDLGGVLLAAYSAGAYGRSSQIEQLLASLQQRGLLADGIAPRKREAERHPDRPLEVLADFSLQCDGNGSCCTTFSSVAFTTEEAERACCLVPDALASDRPEHVFLPTTGSVAGKTCAVTLVDGGCPYLAEDGKCRVQQTGGAGAKPRGCDIFPATFVDDGVAVRVSVAVECRCVISSKGCQDGSPLVPEGASTEADLLPLCRIVRLPEQVALTVEQSAPRGALRAWSEALAGPLTQLSDGVAACWALAESTTECGLDPEAAVAALEQPAAPTAPALGLRLLALAGTTRDKKESAAGWRSQRDRARRLSEWFDQVAQSLLEPAVVAELLEQGATDPAQESLYLSAIIHGHLLVDDKLNLVQALRDRATRLLLARALARSVRLGEVPESCEQDPSLSCPITAVEAMMRGQGLRSYAMGLP